jgi:hypothetical protein
LAKLSHWGKFADDEYEKMAAPLASGADLAPAFA